MVLGHLGESGPLAFPQNVHAELIDVPPAHQGHFVTGLDGRLFARSHGRGLRLGASLDLLRPELVPNDLADGN
jgi:hypothetical protein